MIFCDELDEDNRSPCEAPVSIIAIEPVVDTYPTYTVTRYTVVYGCDNGHNFDECFEAGSAPIGQPII